MSIRRGKYLLLSAVIALLTVGTVGCAVISGKYVTEESFTDEQVRQIRKNQTTKAEILAWFGPPAAIARHGAALKVPSPGPEKRGSTEVPLEQFFNLFAQKNELTKDHIVYYYQDSSLHWVEFFVIKVTFPTTPNMRAKKLWVLINEKTGIVEDTLLGESVKEQDHTWAEPEQTLRAAATRTGSGDMSLWKSGGTNP